MNTVLEKYGGQEHLQKPPDELLFAQTEEYAEYTKAGEVRGVMAQMEALLELLEGKSSRKAKAESS